MCTPRADAHRTTHRGPTGRRIPHREPKTAIIFFFGTRCGGCRLASRGPPPVCPERRRAAASRVVLGRTEGRRAAEPRADRPRGGPRLHAPTGHGPSASNAPSASAGRVYRGRTCDAGRGSAGRAPSRREPRGPRNGPQRPEKRPNAQRVTRCPARPQRFTDGPRTAHEGRQAASLAPLGSWEQPTPVTL